VAKFCAQLICYICAKYVQMNKDLEIYLNLLEMAAPKLWTDERITQLQNLWDQGKERAEIAQIMGVSDASIKGH